MPQHLPPAEWIQGSASDGSEYLIHTRDPIWIARMNGPLSGLDIELATGDRLGHFVFEDEVPTIDDAFIGAANRALEQIDAALGVEPDDDIQLYQ